MALTVVDTLTSEQEEVRASMLAILESASVRVLAGELNGLAVCEIRKDNTCGTEVSKSLNRPGLIAAASLLWHRMMTRGIE